VGGVSHEVRVPLEAVGGLTGDLTLPDSPHGIVLFAHGSGSSRQSHRNQQVAQALNQHGLATLLLDLLLPDEELERANVFDIGLLTERLVTATRWAREQPALSPLATGYFGASTGAAAALAAAAELGEQIRAVVSRGGRPDLATERLPDVRAPVLLIVGERDAAVLELNVQARAQLRVPAEISVVRGATHLFEEPGALADVAQLAAEWFGRHLDPAPDRL
jgi:putative phosphoribosyl transferase